MLQIIKISQEHQKAKYFEQDFDQYQDVWVVNDLRSKMYLQQKILKKDSFFQTESILRVHDFWQQLFLATSSDVKIVSPLFIETWIQEEIISNQEQDSLLYRQSPQFILSLINLLSPIFFDPNGPSQLVSFFNQDPAAQARWQDLAQLGQVLFDIIVNNKKWLLSEWLPNYFLQNSHTQWDQSINRRKIYFDLGVDLKTSESQFISKLGQCFDIIVFEPIFEFSNKQIEFIKAPYQNFSDFTLIKNLNLANESKNIEVHNFSTELTQLKAAVAATQKLINQGVLPKEIVWVMPDINAALPVLELVAEQEGLIFNRPQKIKIKNYLVINQWISRLSLEIGQFEISNLELLSDFSLIKQTDKVSQFKNIHFQSEISEEISQKLGGTKINLETRLLAKDFVELIYNFWIDKEQNQLFWKIIDAFFKEIEESQLFKFSAWFSLLKAIVSKIEILENEGHDEGIFLLNLNEFNLYSAKYIFILSLTERYLSGSEHVQIRSSEFDRLGWDYGYFLDHPNLNRKVADLQWILQSGIANLWLGSFHIDLKGGVTAYHIKFLEMATKYPAMINTNMPSQWDQSMKLLINNTKKFSDLGINENQKSIFKKTIGVTSFNQYAICQFRGVADQIYHYKSKPDVDLDLDKRELGTLHHGLIEKILKNFQSIQDVESFTVNYLKEQKVSTNEYPSFIIFSKRFIKFEAERRKQFPNIKIFQIEMPFQICINVEQGTIQSEIPKDHQNYLIVRGKIDRVDRVDGYYIVIDYKSYSSSDFKFSKWLDSKYYQLAIYGLALELNTDIVRDQLKWGGAEVINYSKMMRDGGFILPDCIGLYTDQAKPRKPILNQELLLDFKKQITQELCVLASQYLLGESSPNVIESKKSECLRCDWRMLCRAPHLDI